MLSRYSHTANNNNSNPPSAELSGVERGGSQWWVRQPTGAKERKPNVIVLLMSVACVQKYLLYSQNSSSNCVSIFGNTFCDFFNPIPCLRVERQLLSISSPSSACKLALFLLLFAIRIDKYLEWILECKRSSFTGEKTPWNDHFKLGNKTLRARFLVVFSAVKTSCSPLACGARKDRHGGASQFVKSWEISTYSTWLDFKRQSAFVIPDSAKAERQTLDGARDKLCYQRINTSRPAVHSDITCIPICFVELFQPSESVFKLKKSRSSWVMFLRKHGAHSLLKLERLKLIFDRPYGVFYRMGNKINGARLSFVPSAEDSSCASLPLRSYLQRRAAALVLHPYLRPHYAILLLKVQKTISLPTRHQELGRRSFGKRRQEVKLWERRFTTKKKNLPPFIFCNFNHFNGQRLPIIQSCRYRSSFSGRRNAFQYFD